MDVSEEDGVGKQLFSMALIVPEQSQRPYRFGMTLLCIGALFNWLGLADSYTEPVPAVRYIGVGLIAVGAALICLAMCCWMRAVQDPQVAREVHNRENVAVQVINIEEPDPRSLEKPPDYSSVVDFPPSYEDAIKELDPAKLLYACALNNNYEPIKTLEDVLIISQLDGDGRVCANKVEEKPQELKELKEPVNETMGSDVSEKDQANVNGVGCKANTLDVVLDRKETHGPLAQPQHTVVDIPESSQEVSNSTNSSSHTNTSAKPGESSSEAEPNLVSGSRSNRITNALRKSFRSLRKTTTSTTSEGNASDICDNETSGASR
ncbi:hypothetical protein M8J77_018149 [Diaphorina citri]|nr:hypothetical protein M8J77_018149 [Diaphorina citri]